MAKIIISYRRGSYDATAGRIRDKLATEYGRDNVYMDVDDIPIGSNFREHIDQALAQADTVVAIIGPKWLGPSRAKGRQSRIFDDMDPVRLEIEAALKHRIAVVPILVDGTRMPKSVELPDSIKSICDTNAAVVDAGRDFHQHMERVIRSTDDILKKRESREKSRWPFGRPLQQILMTIMALAALAGAVGYFTDNLPLMNLLHRFEQPSEQVASKDVPQSTMPPRNQIAPKLAGKRVALVIGNGHYKEVLPLKNPVNDANAISQMFRSMGYLVIAQLDADRSSFYRALQDFQNEAAGAEIAAVYYSGHALELNGTNYLVATDAHLENELDIKRDGIALDAIVSATEEARLLRLVLLDACRGSPFDVSWTTGGRTRGITVTKRLPPSTDIREASLRVGLARVEPGVPNTLIAFAAKAGQAAEDGSGDHSPYATALLKHLPNPDIDVRIALGRVRDDVLIMTANRQEPFVYGSLGGDNIPLAPSSTSAR